MGKSERTESDQYPSWIFVISFTLELVCLQDKLFPGRGIANPPAVQM
jgi:hypothetical protein